MNCPTFGQWQLLQVGMMVSVVFHSFLAIVWQDIPWVQTDIFNSVSAVFLLNISILLQHALSSENLGSQRPENKKLLITVTICSVLHTHKSLSKITHSTTTNITEKIKTLFAYTISIFYRCILSNFSEHISNK